MTRRPSRDSNERVLPGWPRRVDTRVRRVDDCMAGQFDGSRRSSRICDCISIDWPWGAARRRTDVHVDLSGEQLATCRVQQQHSLQQIQCRYDQEVVLSIASFAQQALQARDQSHGHIPLEALLQLGKLSEGWVVLQIAHFLRRRRRRRLLAQRNHRVTLVRWRSSRQAYLREESLDVSKPFADFLR
jgi:hypothetical protein